MSFFLYTNLGASDTTLSLRSSGAQQLAQTTPFPFFLQLTRVSDGAVEIVRAVNQTSLTDLTIIRAQNGTTALTFVAGDGCLLVPGIPQGNIIPVAFGSPLAADTNAIHAAITLTGSPQTITTAFTDPDVCRVPTIKGNAGGMAGNVVLTCVDSLGATFTQTVALSGSSTVAGTKACVSVTQAVVPAETHVGTDTIEIGFSDKLGLPFQTSYPICLLAMYNGVAEGTAPTLTVGATVAECTIDLNTVLAGASVFAVFVALN